MSAMQRSAAPPAVVSLRRVRGRCCSARATRPVAAALQAGSHTQMGTSRKQNEDRWVTQARVAQRSAQGLASIRVLTRRAPQTALPVAGGSADYFGVYDGHGELQPLQRPAGPRTGHPRVSEPIDARARAPPGGFGASQWLIDNLGPLLTKTFTPGNAKKARQRKHATQPRHCALFCAAAERASDALISRSWAVSLPFNR
jgi:hypothetical protein